MNINYDISEDIIVFENEMSTYFFLLESDDSVIENYYLIDDQLLYESEDSNSSGKTSIFKSIIESIKRFITKCRIKLLKLIGSDKYKVLEDKINKDKELANKQIKFDSKTKEMDVLKKDSGIINNIFKKIKNGTASDEEVQKIEKQCEEHKSLFTVSNIGIAALGTYGLGKLINMWKDKERDKNRDPEIEFIYQKSFLNEDNTALSEKQIKQFKELYNAVKDNVEAREKLIMETTTKLNAILDNELKQILEEHEETSKEAKNIADNKKSSFPNNKKKDNENKSKFEDRETKSKIRRNYYDIRASKMDFKDKEMMAKDLKDEIDDNKKYIRKNESAGKTVKRGYKKVRDKILYRYDSDRDK